MVIGCLIARLRGEHCEEQKNLFGILHQPSFLKLGKEPTTTIGDTQISYFGLAGVQVAILYCGTTLASKSDISLERVKKMAAKPSNIGTLGNNWWIRVADT